MIMMMINTINHYSHHDLYNNDDDLQTTLVIIVAMPPLMVTMIKKKPRWLVPIMYSHSTRAGNDDVETVPSHDWLIKHITYSTNRWRHYVA